MPIIAIYALIAALIFGAGGATVWRYDQGIIAGLNASIKQSNINAQNALNKAKNHVQEVERAQEITEIQLEAEYDKRKKNSANANSALAAARMQWNADKPRSDCRMPESNNSSINKKDDGGGFYLSAAELSAELDKLVQKKSLLADTIDSDKHFILTWLNSLPPELIEQ